MKSTVLYAIGKACNRWATSRDDSVSGQGVVTAIVALLSNFSQRCWTDAAGNNGSSPVESVDWLLILEFYTALKYMSTYVPEPVIASELLGRTVRLLEFVHASKDVPNRDAVREACLGVLTQAGNLDGGRTKLLAGKICFILYVPLPIGTGAKNKAYLLVVLSRGFRPKAAFKYDYRSCDLTLSWRREDRIAVVVREYFACGTERGDGLLRGHLPPQRRQGRHRKLPSARSPPKASGKHGGSKHRDEDKVLYLLPSPTTYLYRFGFVPGCGSNL